MLTFTEYDSTGRKTECEFKPGQVWRQYDSQDYGDIQRWQVMAVGKRVMEVQNCATLQRKAVLADSVSSFTFDNELLEEPPRLQMESA